MPKENLKVRIIIFENFIRGVNQSAILFFLIWLFSLENSYGYEISSIIAISMAINILIKLLLGWLGDTYASRMFIVNSFYFYALSIALLYLGFLHNNGLFFSLSVLLSSVSNGFRSMISMKIIKENARDSLSIISFGSILGSVSPLLGPVLGSFLVASHQADLLIYSFSFTMVVLVSHFFLILKFSNGLIFNNAKRVTYLEEIKLGFVSVVRVKPELMMCISASTLNFMLLSVFVIFIPNLIYNTYNLSSWYVAIVDIAFSLGILGGSKYINTFILKSLGHYKTIILGYFLVSFFILSTLFFHLYLVITLAFTGGLGLALININSSNIRVKAYPKEVLGRASNIVTAISSATSPMGVFFFNSVLLSNGLEALSYAIFIPLAILLLTLVCNSDMFYMSKLSDEGLESYYRERYNV